MTTNTPKRPLATEARPRRDGRVSRALVVLPRARARRARAPLALGRAQREAGRNGAVAAGDVRALAQAETRQAQRMLESSEQLAERRYERLACGISCLGADIEAARAAARRARCAPKAPGERQGCVEPHARPPREQRTRASGARA